MEIARCKKWIMWTAIYQGGHRRRCKRNSIKDGYCRQHHPDEVKRRETHRSKVLEVTPMSFLIRRKPK